jgi:hypothetical protein
MAPPEATPSSPFEQSLSCLDWGLDAMDDELLCAVSESSYHVSLRDWYLPDDVHSHAFDDDDDWRMSLSSPTAPFDEFGMDRDSDDFFLFDTPLTEDEKNACSLPFEQRFEVTRQNLEASMRRSQETRQSLVIKTFQVEKNDRNDRHGSVKGVVDSVEESAQRLQTSFIAAKIVPKLNTLHAQKG